MESRIKLFGHPIHPMLVVFPLGLLATSFVFDIAFRFTGHEDLPTVSYWLVAAGVIGGALAAPFGLIDWLAIPRGTRAKRIGALHGGGNAVVLLLFAVSWWIRSQAPLDQVPGLAFGLSLIGIGLALFTWWMGGELVGRLGVGVSSDANLDAPSSLDRHPRAEERHPATAHR